MRLIASPGVVLLFLLLPGLTSSCGHIQPTPQSFLPEDYTPVNIEQLQSPRKAGLTQGQKVSVEGYFWQYLDYDPFMVAKYLAWARHPLGESRLSWASLYHTPQMQGYFDRLVLTREQRQDWSLKRLEHVRVFGQLSHLEFGILYLQAHHVDRLDVQDGPFKQRPTASAFDGQENPSP